MNHGMTHDKPEVIWYKHPSNVPVRESGLPFLPNKIYRDDKPNLLYRKYYQRNPVVEAGGLW